MGRKSRRISSKLIVWTIEEHGDVQLDPIDVVEIHRIPGPNREQRQVIVKFRHSESRISVI